MNLQSALSFVLITIEKNLTSRNALSKSAYPLLSEHKIPSFYYLAIINKAIALIRTYRKRLRKSKILIPISEERDEEIELNKYVQKTKSEVKVHSFTLNMSILSLSIENDIEMTENNNTKGVDRNLKNMRLGNEENQ